MLALILCLPGQSRAAEGIDVKVVAEWPVDIPGIEKMQLRRVVFQPGATIDLTITHVEFCNGTQGEWAVTIPAGGQTTLHTAGSRWRMPAKGTKITVTNPGDVPAVQFVYRLIEKGT
ncbi:MAG: hypothetical protein V3S40_10840 [Kiloniellales bacterium]